MKTANRRRNIRYLWIIPAALWLILILMLSSQTYQQQTIIPYLMKLTTPKHLSESLPDITIRYGSKVVNAKIQPLNFVEFIFRKTAHFLIYMTMAMLCVKVLHAFFPRLWGKTVIVFFVCVMVSMLDERIQMTSHSRTPAVEDILLDLAGACTGLLLSAIIMRWRRWRSTG